MNDDTQFEWSRWYVRMRPRLAPEYHGCLDSFFRSFLTTLCGYREDSKDRIAREAGVTKEKVEEFYKVMEELREKK